jgi:TonB family protein
MLRNGALLLLLIAASWPGCALSDDASSCSDQKADADVRITACTAVLQTGKQDKRGKSRVLTSRGASHYQKEDFDEALADLDEAVKNDPNNANAFAQRGSTHWARLEDEQAFKDFDKALRLDTTPERLVLRARRYIDIMQSDAAIADLTRAIAIDSRMSEAYRYRGVAHGQKKEFDLAIADLDRTLQIDPLDKQAAPLRDSIRTAKGENLNNLRDYGPVLTARLQILKMFPRTARRDKLEGTTRVFFLVVRDGTLWKSRVVQSSGSDVLDQEALNLVRRIRPLPPLPVGTGFTEEFVVPIEFRIPHLHQNP